MTQNATASISEERVSPLALDQNLINQLLTCPLGITKGRLLLNSYRALNQADQDAEAGAAAQQLRMAALILQNIGINDAADYSRERDEFASWFFNARKKLAQGLLAEAARLDPQPAMQDA